VGLPGYWQAFKPYHAKLLIDNAIVKTYLLSIGTDSCSRLRQVEHFVKGKATLVDLTILKHKYTIAVLTWKDEDKKKQNQVRRMSEERGTDE
jgi:hypothetical protein